MTMIKCSECRAEISSEATTCPQCGKPNVQTAGAALQGILGVVVLLGLGWWFFGGGMDSQVNSTMDDITSQVAGDSVDQYNIAAAQGDPMQKCVQAGLVSSAFLQAQDTSNYNLWKAREAADCVAAGVPR